MKSTRLYSFAIPLTALPLLDFHLSQLPGWFLSEDFRQLLSQMFTQIFSGLFGTVINGFVNAIFGVTG